MATDLIEAIGFLARALLRVVQFVAGLLEFLTHLDEIGGAVARRWKRWRARRVWRGPEP